MSSLNVEEKEVSKEAPGVALMKLLWDIPDRSRERERPPKEVNTDIYSTGAGNFIPPRSSSHH